MWFCWPVWGWAKPLSFSLAQVGQHPWESNPSKLGHRRGRMGVWKSQVVHRGTSKYCFLLGTWLLYKAFIWRCVHCFWACLTFCSSPLLLFVPVITGIWTVCLFIGILLDSFCYQQWRRWALLLDTVVDHEMSHLFSSSSVLRLWGACPSRPSACPSAVSCLWPPCAVCLTWFCLLAFLKATQ